MKRFLLLSVLIVSFFGASAQRYFYSRPTLGGASGYFNIQLSDIPDLSTVYQPLLISGTNIKTINSQSLLGSGNITINSSFSDQSSFTGFLAPLPELFNFSGQPIFRPFNNSDLPIRNGYKVRLTGVPKIFGDSFTTGSGASPGTFAWLEQFKAANGGITVDNQAVGARGINTAVLAAYSVMPQFMNGNTAILMVGFNDGGRNGDAASTLSKIANGNRAIAVNTWLKFAVAASAATNTGTWSNYTAQTLKASNLGGNTRQSSTAANTISYTTTEASDNIVIGTIGTDGVTYDYGRFSVTIDGTLLDTYDPNGQTDGVSDGSADNGRTPNVLVYNGLRNSTHTVTLTVLDAKTTVIDFIGYMMKPEECAGVIVSSIPRRNAAGYASGSATDETVTATNTYIEADLESNFPFRPWVFVRQERYFDVATDISGDDIHPNNGGHGHLFQAMQNAVRENSNISSTVRFFPHTTTGPSAWLSNAGMGFSLFHNTNTATNAVIDATAGSSIFQSNVTAGAGNTALTYFASASGGGNPSQRWRMDNTGKHTWSNMTDGTFLDATSGSISHMAVGNMEVLAGASKNSAGQYTAKLTAASVLNVSPGSGMVLFSNPSGLTIGNTYSPTEIGRIGSTIVRFSANTLIGNNSSSPNSTLHVEGSMANAYVARTTALTLGATHYLVEVTSGTHTQTLPTAVGITGRTYVITNSGSGTVTVGTTSSQTFVNVSGTPTTLTLNQFQTVTVVSNGQNWLRISTL